MANLILPDPRMEMPELLEPGRKPIGPVSIDRDHWAGKHAQRVILPRAGQVIELVTNDILTPSGTALVNSKQNAEFDDNGDNDKFQLHSKTPVFNQITVLAKVKRRAAGGGEDMGIYSDMYIGNWVSSGISLNLRNASSGILFAVGNSQVFTNSTDVAINTWMHVCGTWSVNTMPKTYLNGIELFSGSSGSGGAYAISTGGDARIGTYYNEAADRTLDGEIEYVYVFDVAFTAEQQREIIRDPYQFLIPA